jgi:uncharacterized protein YxjI
MTLYIKQKVFSWKDKFTIKDAAGNDRYYVEGELFSWGHKLHVYNAAGREVAFLKQKLMTIKPRFEVYVGDRLEVEVVKEITLFRDRYSLLGTDWTVRGDLLDHNYSIMNGMRTIATISKAWFTWGDSYEVNIDDGINDVLVVATVLAIDCVNDANNN